MDYRLDSLRREKKEVEWKIEKQVEARRIAITALSYLKSNGIEFTMDYLERAISYANLQIEDHMKEFGMIDKNYPDVIENLKESN